MKMTSQGSQNRSKTRRVMPKRATRRRAITTRRLITIRLRSESKKSRESPRSSTVQLFAPELIRETLITRLIWTKKMRKKKEETMRWKWRTSLPQRASPPTKKKESRTRRQPRLNSRC